jgi:uncharacterized membrane protein
VLQGVLGGVVLALGYLSGRIIEGLWWIADFPVLRGRARQAVLLLLSLAVLAALGLTMRYSHGWQNDLRARMGMEPAAGGHLADAARRRGGLCPALWPRAARGGGLAPGARAALPGDAEAAGGRAGLPARRARAPRAHARRLARRNDRRDGHASFEAAQDLFDTAPPAPGDPRVPGSAASLVDWQAMGQPGRDFVTTGPDAAAISAFSGRPALDPIRVYVGRANAQTPQERADLALAELERLGAFDRRVLVVASPTGTGWMDPGSHDPVEYMHDGDIATVAVQYSYLQSPFALLFETETGLEQATATVATIHAHWRRLPEATRPRLYIHGLSLGAWSSMYATTLFQLVSDPIAGAFWAGRPSRRTSGTASSAPGTTAAPGSGRRSATAR